MDQDGNEIILAESGRAGLVKLNRPKALNAVTFVMIRALEPFYHRCAKNPHIYGIVMEAEGKAFSAGGDIRTLHEWIQNDIAEADQFYAEEYQHNWTLESFRKPHVALMNGIAMGGGAGISLYGTHRAAGENMAFAMPETGIGFFPDIGGGWFLPRMPGMIGMYLGLTGYICDRASAYYAGVVTHCIPAAQFVTVKEAMTEGEPVDPILDGLHEQPGESFLERHREPIDRIFAAASLDEILTGLEREVGPWRGWARETLETLGKKSPLALKITFEQLRRGRQYRTLKEALVVEYRLATRTIRQPDFPEGIRAVIVDKDYSPKWQPASLAEVDDGFVQSLFAPLPAGDLLLEDYWTPPATP
ncbi:MAG: enoyl-CoA hydratase/isomerase family protein [Rhodomicrobium sp.]